MYERFRAPLLSRAAYARRLLWHFLVVTSVAAASLVLGMWGYHRYEDQPWLDAFLNAAMLLGGEGPIGQPRTPAGKLFAGLYALYSGVVFIAAAGIMLAPVGHRVLHHFHFDDEDDAGPRKRSQPQPGRGAP